MGKLLSWLLLAALVWLAWKFVVVSRRKAARRGAGAGEAAKPAGPEEMVRCARCGVHLPKSDAITVGERHFCCAAHRDAG